MRKHGNSGKRNAFKSGRSRTLSVRVTQEVYDRLKNNGGTAGDQIERLVLNEMKTEEIRNDHSH